MDNQIKVPFSTVIDPNLKKELKIHASTHDITIFELVDRLLRLVFKCGSIEELEKLYENAEKK